MHNVPPARSNILLLSRGGGEELTYPSQADFPRVRHARGVCPTQPAHMPSTSNTRSILRLVRMTGSL